ncbi:hypothetical protein CDAR_372501 [Caerostris darwini]|uniref:Uncharacterized protein n=1 Tax=Caerostris darwini TaxID=1538125 RepID=A0AAV4T6Q2_9ARAC|nr:hypothetical protein CDAR_372501 [Caerostris darwini]
MTDIIGWPHFYRHILNYTKTALIKSSFSAGADIPDSLSVPIPHKNPPTNLGGHKGGQLRDYSAAERNGPGDKATNISVGAHFFEKRR